MSDLSSRKILSLFTGAGGLDFGFEAAGFETAVAVEMDGRCAETLRLATDWPVIERDVHEVPSEELLEVAGLAKGDAGLLIGGPPCQPFSKSGFWATGESRRLTDPRAKTLDAYLRVLEDALPEAFLLENVAGLGYSGKAEGLEYLRARIAEINGRQGTDYRVEVMRLNAAHFGVPQLRERMVLVAQREGLSFGELRPTHRLAESGTQADFSDLDLPKVTTAWDAVGHLDGEKLEELELRGKWAELLPSIPEGRNYLFHTDRGEGLPLFGWRRRFWNFLLKLAKDRPSWTLTAQPGPATGPFHWKNRHLSPAEMAALQTFPADFRVAGSRVEAQKQLGNAVPSALAEVVALKIRARYFGEVEYENCTATLVPEKRGPAPPPEKAREVPEKYRSLAGGHSAHPGTGKGYGALRNRGKSGGRR